MRRCASSLLRGFRRKLIGRRTINSLIVLLSHLADVDLLVLAHHEMGILKYKNSLVSGEQYVIRHVLGNALGGRTPILFDVGANRGDYSKELRAQFPEAHLYAFEPNPNAFRLLLQNMRSPSDHCYCLGFGSAPGRQTIYTYRSALDSTHASMYEAVFPITYRTSDTVAIDIDLGTLDGFCSDNKIGHIDFLKIDTEGNELDVLRGAERMLAERCISMIQFEFNEMNVVSRVFLKDFFDLLSGFDMYRLDTQKLIPLASYDTLYEIFKFQNLLAIQRH